MDLDNVKTTYKPRFDLQSLIADDKPVLVQDASDARDMHYEDHSFALTSFRCVGKANSSSQNILCRCEYKCTV